MKRISNLFLLLFTIVVIKAQNADPAVTGAYFSATSVQVGSQVNLITSFSNAGINMIPIGTIELTISSPSVYYKSNGTNAPTGSGAMLFTWTYIGNDIWRGVNSVAIMPFSGGDIVLAVTGVSVTPTPQVLNLNVQPVSQFMSFNDSPANNNLQPTLSVLPAAAPCPTPDIIGNLFTCPGESIILSVDTVLASSNYTWTVSPTAIVTPLPNGQARITFPQNATGNFTVMVTETNSTPTCSAKDEVIVSIIGSTSMICDNSINVSLDTNCLATITSSMILISDIPAGYQFPVTIKDADGKIIPQPLTKSEVDKTLTVEVSDCYGNKCWGTAKIEDKLPPKAICPSLPDILCTQTPSFPDLVVNDCSPVLKTFTDATSGEDCTGKIVTRIWKIVDAHGIVGQNCVQTIKLLPVNIANVSIPTQSIEVNGCSKLSVKPEDLVSLVAGGTNALFPTANLNGVITPIRSSICNVASSYKDEVFDIPCGRKIIRTWTVLDWCTQTKIENNQVIKIVDTERPTVAVMDSILINVDPWTCEAEFEMPAGVATDVCDSLPTIQITATQSNISIVGRKVKGLKPGIYRFQYNAIDKCGNISLPDYINVIVRDNSAPVAVVKEFIVLNLTNDAVPGTAGAKLFATNVDEGSYDKCGPISIKIRRTVKGCDPLNDTFRDHVKFCCQDIGIHEVKIQVCDISGNCNETWAKVKVESKQPVVITCPAERTVSCEDDIKISEIPTSLSSTEVLPTGNATAQGLCAAISMSYVDKLVKGACGVTSVTRTFTAKGNTEVSCNQIINITYPNVFAVAAVTNDLIVTDKCEITKEDFATGGSLARFKPAVTSSRCDIIGENFDIQLFDIEDGVCKKWLVTISYINWCTNQRIERLLKVAFVDNTKPTLACVDQMFDASGGSNGCQGTVALTSKAVDTSKCSSQGWLKWHVSVDFNSDGSIDRIFSSSLASNNSNYIKPTSSGEIVRVPTFMMDNSMANHKVFWTVADGCGNTSTCTTNYMVADKKAPTPYCVGLSTAIMRNGSVELWAKDFDKGSYDNCTAATNLLFTFDNESPIPSKLGVLHFFKNGVETTEAEYLAGRAQKWNPTTKTSGRVFNCEDVIKTQPIGLKVTVWDEKNNNDFCLVNITLIDNQSACGGSKTIIIGGEVKTQTGEGINNTELRLSSTQDPRSILSNSEGTYYFNNLTQGVDYVVSCKKRDDWLNGISTLDLVHIQRHILGVSKINSPYNLVAADVNNDRRITASDLVVLRKAILGVIEDFPDNDSWRYIDIASPIANPEYPWPLIETIFVTASVNPVLDKNFMGIKIGDVNNSARGNALSSQADPRTNKGIVFTVNNASVINNEIIEIPVRASSFEAVYGFQLTLNSDLEIKSVKSGVIEITNANFATLKHGKTTISWSSDKAISSTDEVLFTIVAKAGKTGKLSDMINISSDLLRAESYISDDLETGKVKLEFSVNPVSGQYILGQNEPNPFQGETSIKFEVPKAEKVKFTIRDVSGRLLTTKIIDAVPGLNSVSFLYSEVKATGLLYYTMETGSFKASKHMIVIE